MSDKLVLEVGKYYRDISNSIFKIFYIYELKGRSYAKGVCVIPKGTSITKGDAILFTINGRFFAESLGRKLHLIEEVNFTGDKNEN